MCEIQKSESKLLDVDICSIYIITISDPVHYCINSIGKPVGEGRKIISEFRDSNEFYWKHDFQCRGCTMTAIN